MEKDKKDYVEGFSKGFWDAETTVSQPVPIEQTMKDAETHFELQYSETKPMNQ